MRIAIPVTDGRIPNHLGHCRAFLLVDVADGKVVAEREVANPGHGPGGPPPAFVARQGATQVLAWGMPPHAQGLLRDAGIPFLLGVTGDPRQAVRDFLAGTLALTGEGLDAGGGCGHSPHDACHDEGPAHPRP
jgi:predicted Fe-Mo cluster-binding NifX family protein